MDGPYIPQSYHHEIEQFEPKYVNHLPDCASRIFSWLLDYPLLNCKRSTPQVHPTILHMSRLKDGETVIPPPYIRNDAISGTRFQS